MVLTILISIPVGIISAYRQYSIFDQAGTFVTMVGFSVPPFFSGVLVIVIFLLVFTPVPLLIISGEPLLPEAGTAASCLGLSGIALGITLWLVQRKRAEPSAEPPARHKKLGK